MVDGAVRFYIQDYTFFNGLSSGQNNYYCVKRPNEEKVTVLYVKRQGVNHVYLETGNVWTDIVADIFVMAASNIAEDLHATGQVSINDLKKTAAEYFEDCAPLVKRIEVSKYNSPNTIHKLVERYNFYKVNNPAGDN